MSQHYDVIVIGAGGMGSAATYYLAKSNQRVLLLEQFELDHRNGSSYGYSRVIRYSYDNPIYIELMRAAYFLWYALQEEAKETLYVPTGGLDFGFPDTPTWQSLQRSMDTAKLPYEELSCAEAKKRFPQFHLEEGMKALYQPATGLLAASKCVLAHTRLAQANGATVRDRTPVTQIVPHAQSVEVHTPQETYTADKLIITAGSWAKHHLSPLGVELPVRIMPCQLAFFAPENQADYEPGRFPVFFAHMNGDYGEMPYGIPAHDNSGVKITTFYGWDTVSDPSEVDYNPDPQWVERMRGFARRYIPGANGALVSTRRCLYTMTPDKHFVIDRVPEYPHVIFGAGFSGHGFKFTTLVGNILAQLVTEGTTAHDLSLFSASRFEMASTNLAA